VNTKGAVLTTPDGRYIVVRGRLWRKANPHLPANECKQLVADLMSARRAVKDATGDEEATRAARKAVDAAKVALGERGPVWWTDGAPDLNRHMARTTCYADWFAERAEATGATNLPADDVFARARTTHILLMTNSLRGETRSRAQHRSPAPRSFTLAA
jgi:hypothetical protein